MSLVAGFLGDLKQLNSFFINTGPTKRDEEHEIEEILNLQASISMTNTLSPELLIFLKMTSLCTGKFYLLSN
jgi:hypothetical protein